MQIRDQAAWQRWQDANPPPSWGPELEDWPDHMSDEDMGRGYGYTVIEYAQRWADEMEDRLAAGEALEDIAKRTSHNADHSLGRWGITGFQYGAAVQVLVDVWVHGEELRRWHNLTTQLNDEGERANETGGVLNPAIMQIGTDDD